MIRHLLFAILLLVAFLRPVEATEPQHELAGPYIGIVAGHSQMTGTVYFPQDGGQINDVSGNDVLIGLRSGYSWVTPSNVFLGLDAYGTYSFRPGYPTTIVNFGGQQFEVSNTWRLGTVGRLGFALRENAAIYALAGVSAGNSDYIIQGQAYSRTSWQPEIGAGMEVSIAGGAASLRLDVQWAPYRRDLPADLRETGAMWTGLFTLRIPFRTLSGGG
jgi:opacity protein-like surface antigen